MKRCPFCAVTRLSTIKSKSCVQIRCAECGAMGPTAGNVYDARNYWNDRFENVPTGKRYKSTADLMKDLT